MKVAIIFGITGQDGIILSSILIKNKYKVIGVTRNKIDISNCANINLEENIKIIELKTCTVDNIIKIIQLYNPDEIYNLAGQTSVYQSFLDPIGNFDSNVNNLLILLESILLTNNKIKFFNASSSDCFGDCNTPANENTIFKPVSPYGISKSISHSLVKFYRENFGLFSVSGILSNHESQYRKPNFVLKKIINFAVKAHFGYIGKLKLGNIDIIRDWGYAVDYCDAIYLMNTALIPNDYIIATGDSHSLKEVIQKIFAYLNLNYIDYIKVDKSLFRENEIKSTLLDPTKINSELKWKATKQIDDILEILIKHELDLSSQILTDL